MSDVRCPWCGEPYHAEEDGSTVYYSQHDPEECRDTLRRKLAAKNQELQSACDVIEAACDVIEAVCDMIEAAHKVVEAISKVAERGPLHVPKLRGALLRYAIQRGDVIVEEDDGTP